MGGDRAVPHRDAASRPDLYGGGLRNRPGQDQGSGIRAAMRGREAAPPAFRSKVALLLAAAAFLLSSCSSFFQGSAPQRDGVLAAPGLSAPAENVRERSRSLFCAGVCARAGPAVPDGPGAAPGTGGARRDLRRKGPFR